MFAKNYSDPEKMPPDSSLNEPQSVYGSGIDRSDVEWWNEISEQDQQAIEKGLSDIEAGRTIPHSEMRKRYKKWL
ncbi:MULTISPECIES: hypothetical protein [Parabacteroides]|jgi:hypothetical protein|uniref:hypothetical protein n=1 Tax=Parabacteroides TaxID=375288 RepID=UPI000EFED728|nr:MULTISPECIES: hypothetical protein [Parabacteroides]RHU30707.1 hypothetical protein DXD68_02505 [Parabacteroides sp. TM07-1AC]WFE84056.1 hypothetical protein P3L47_18215 [Parabacteroides chongii]